jgi:hypothetical protein
VPARKSATIKSHAEASTAAAQALRIVCVPSAVKAYISWNTQRGDLASGSALEVVDIGVIVVPLFMRIWLKTSHWFFSTLLCLIKSTAVRSLRRGLSRHSHQDDFVMPGSPPEHETRGADTAQGGSPSIELDDLINESTARMHWPR